uniref:Uncharacterized protein n=1 Tax=Aegilops tauschii subsp. strangulata TaxID=200361 RepID=A0A453MLD8_AEGTS
SFYRNAPRLNQVFIYCPPLSLFLSSPSHPSPLLQRPHLSPPPPPPDLESIPTPKSPTAPIGGAPSGPAGGVFPRGGAELRGRTD